MKRTRHSTFFIKVQFLDQSDFILYYLWQMEVKTDLKSVAQGISLPLMEAFYTLQGEGYHKGSAAYFIRIGGCDVGCHWCDVKESWDESIHPRLSVGFLADEVLNTDARKKGNNVIFAAFGGGFNWGSIYLKWAYNS